MLKLVRFLLLAVLLVPLWCVSIFLLLFRPFHPNSVYLFSKPMSWFLWLFGVRVEIRGREHTQLSSEAVIAVNHQNSWDIFIGHHMCIPRTVTIGKKSLKWIPLFGQLYWLTGNILIDRKRSTKAAGSLFKAAELMHERQVNVLMFPEGTRSYGRGLLPFKTGAFRLAQAAKAPILPLCVSDTTHQFDMGRWDNGVVYMEYLEPVMVGEEDDIRKIADKLHRQMQAKIAQLTFESEQTYATSSRRVKSV